MYVETVGNPQGPDLVLLHGGIGTGRYHWSKQLKALGENFLIHLPDLPGHGRSPTPADRPYGRDVLVEAVAELLESIGLPVHVGGFSMGGHTSLALAERRPAMFASMLLVGVSIREHPGLGKWREQFEPSRFEAEYPLWARHLSKLHEPLGGTDAWRDVVRRDASGTAVDVDVAALGELDCPVLLVRGDRDPAVDPSQYAELRQVWRQADELVVPAGRHDVQLTRRRLVEPALVDFYDRVLD